MIAIAVIIIIKYHTTTNITAHSLWLHSFLMHKTKTKLQLLVCFIQRKERSRRRSSWFLYTYDNAMMIRYDPIQSSYFRHHHIPIITLCLCWIVFVYRKYEPCCCRRHHHKTQQSNHINDIVLRVIIKISWSTFYFTLYSSPKVSQLTGPIKIPRKVPIVVLFLKYCIHKVK